MTIIKNLNKTINYINLSNSFKIKQIIIIIKNLKLVMDKNKFNYQYGFSLPLILSNINLNVDESDPNFILIKFCFALFTISLTGLFCFINISGYIIYIKLKKQFNRKIPKNQKNNKNLILYFYKTNFKKGRGSDLC